MKQYETMYIIKSSLDDAAKAALVEELHAIITNHGGKIDNVEDWGLREFAYEIDGMTKGYYVVTTYTIDTDGLNEFKRLLGINADVVRSMTINTEEKAGK
ncbi:MAG: 30S ribosomal protein S6 [Erysipelotrichaceae bacterium]|nr:30S ribosomal protein S6 [Erysipelotrichaceae bacterium]